MGINIDAILDEIKEFEEIKEMLDFIIKEVDYVDLHEFLEKKLFIRKEIIKNHRIIAESEKESTIKRIDDSFQTFFKNIYEYIEKENRKKWED
jgi:hypothetical protein